MHIHQRTHFAEDAFCKELVWERVLHLVWSHTHAYTYMQNFELMHVGPGILTMVNNGPDTNSSQFAVLLARYLLYL